jgi:hypothetical protein
MRRKWIPWVLGGALLVTFPLYAPVACTAPDRARETLAAQGYTKIEITGYAYLACGSDDRFATAFTALGPSGQQVEGAVCSGFFKGNTVRLD